MCQYAIYAILKSNPNTLDSKVPNTLYGRNLGLNTIYSNSNPRKYWFNMG